eukprot:TRINITY_DN2513_c0_g2_i1.p1 TRINITY_DN2513_c0_g2~~TRINITY_DN2513_c0_g2_i1.p1  ORF type:complete len:121 (-),score=33.63 TRINITY_DN2513_c0_g2_i1:283-645(-)
MVQAEILVGSCSAFGNNNGVLFCADMDVNADDVPLGDYVKSCGGCSITDGVLICKKCKNTLGEFVESRVVVGNCENFTNNDGKIVCKPLEAFEEENSHPQQQQQQQQKVSEGVEASKVEL